MATPLRATFCGTSYPSSPTDWKGVFLRHLLFALARREGLDLACWLPPGEIPAGARRFGRPDDADFLGRLLRSGGIAQALRRPNPRTLLVPVELLYRLHRAYRSEPRFDLHHVNWLQHALVLPDDGAPALVSALGTDMSLLSIPGMATMLRRAFKRRRVVLAPNAPWMAERLHRLFGDVCEVTPVSFGIDQRWFDIERSIADDTPTWLVVSRVTKGKIGDLFDWAEPLFTDGRRRLVLIGPLQDDVAIPDWIDYRGAASAHDLATRWFPTATGIITLSRHPEGRPQLMLEAAASGLPIVASDLRAHLDFREEGCPLDIVDTPHQFAEAVPGLEDPAINLATGAAMRTWALASAGTWDDCAARYAAVYDHLAGVGR